MRVPLSINLSLEMANHLRAFAAKQETPASRIVEGALKEYIGSPSPLKEGVHYDNALMAHIIDETEKSDH